MTEDISPVEKSPAPEEPKQSTKRFFNPGAWSAIFTGVLVFFTRLLYKVNDRATEASIASQRAFLSFSGPALIKDIQKGKWTGLRVYYLWSNSGTTPAKDGTSEWNMSFGPIVPAKGLDFDSLPQNERHAFVIGPKAAYQLSPVYLSTQDLEAVAENKKHLFFWGWVTYRDIFSGTPLHLTEFCTEITSAVWTQQDHASPAADWNTTSPSCPVHNCYDEDCEDYSTRTRR